jgi:uncharacterized integral membrane protein
MIRLVFALVPALWVIAIAIVAVQNATPVSFRLLNLQSIEIPFGVLLAFCVAAGMLAAALVLLVLGGNPLRFRNGSLRESPRRQKQRPEP